MMENRPNRDLLLDLNDDLDCTILDEPHYDSAILGLSHDGRIIYSYDLMIEFLMVEDGMTMEEAMEFIDYNTIRALPYMQNAPIILYDLPKN